MRCSGQILVRVVLQLAVQITHEACVNLDGFVAVHAVPARVTAIVEAELIVGIHVGCAHPAAEVERTRGMR